MFENLLFRSLQLVYTIFITNNHTSFRFWWKEKLVKYQKSSGYGIHDCLQNSISLFISLIAASIVENSDFLAGIYFSFLKHVLDQTWKHFNSKFWHQETDSMRSFQVRQNLALFCNLLAQIFRWNCVKGIIVMKFLKKNQVWGKVELVRSKRLFQRQL